MEEQKAAITQPTERGVPLNAKGSGTMGVRNVAKAAGTQTEGRGIKPAIMTSLLQGPMELVVENEICFVFPNFLTGKQYFGFIHPSSGILQWTDN